MNKKIGATLFILFALLGQIVGIWFVKVEIFQANENTNNIFEDRNSSLHSASTTFIIPSVPHYYQTTNYYCGPASVQMVYDFYGPYITQLEIADVARADSSYGCYTDDLRRATHFSRLSTSVGNDMPGSITGYTNRSIGYGAFEVQSLTVNYLVDIVGDGHPMVVLQWYDGGHTSGHFRVVIGYVRNSGITQLIVHDPWYSGPGYTGPNVYIGYSTFTDLWAYSSNWALFICPWDVTVNCSSLVAVNSTFTVRANVEYVIPSLFTPVYTASICKATIQLPAGFSLAPGEMYTKNLNPVNLPAGDVGTATWQVVADVLNSEDFISVNASGSVSGSVSAHGPYSAYGYTDLIGGNGSKLVKIIEEIPEININKPSQDEKFGDNAPDYNISIVTQNLESMWYTIDGGVTNYTITQFTGTINQTAWDAAPYGNITIRFYAKNLAGIIGYSEVVIEKLEEIPGDNNLKLIIIMSAIIGSAVVIGVAVILIVRGVRRKVSE